MLRKHLLVQDSVVEREMVNLTRLRKREISKMCSAYCSFSRVFERRRAEFDTRGPFSNVSAECAGRREQTIMMWKHLKCTFTDKELFIRFTDSGFFNEGRGGVEKTH